MKRKTLIALAAVLAAAVAGLVVALAVTGGTPARHHHPAAARDTAATTAAATRTCGQLAAAAIPLTAYDQAVINETAALAHQGNASRAQVRQALHIVAAEVRSACPQFAYLIAQETGS